jgi:hypothetical protein
MAYSDSQQKSLGKKFAVGLDQLNNPTPMWIKWPIRVLIFLTGLWAYLEPQMTDLVPADLAYLIGRWSTIITAVLFFLSKTTGWDFKSK